MYLYPRINGKTLKKMKNSTQCLKDNKSLINIDNYYNLETLEMTKKDRMDIFVVFLVCF